MRIIAIDPSMTSAGLAIFSGEQPTTLHTVESAPERKRKKGDPPATLEERDRRLSSIVERIRAITLPGFLWPDLVIIEGPAYSANNAGTWDRAGLWWLILRLFTDQEVPVALCPSTSRCVFATGNGRAGKDEVLAAAVRRYPELPIANNDEADAAVMLGAALTKLSLPTATVPATHRRALDGIEWPTKLF